MFKLKQGWSYRLFPDEETMGIIHSIMAAYCFNYNAAELNTTISFGSIVRYSFNLFTKPRLLYCILLLKTNTHFCSKC